MKKLLILIMIGFVLTSIFTLIFTIQFSSTLGEFSEDDNGDGDDFDNFFINDFEIVKQGKYKENLNRTEMLYSEHNHKNHDYYNIKNDCISLI